MRSKIRPQKILFWNPEKRFSKFPLRAPFAVLPEELDDSCNNQKTTKYVEDDTECARRTIISTSPNSGPIKSVRFERVINPPQTNKKMPEDKNQPEQRDICQKDVPLKPQRSANNCKRFIPVINFHVLKADLLVVATLLNSPKLVVILKDTTSPDRES